MKLLGIGSALPFRRMTAAEVDRTLGKPAGWSFDLTGVTSRAVAVDETQIDLAVTASRTALDDAGIPAADLDFIVFASAIPYQTLPSTAPLIQLGLGLDDGAVATFDVNSTCLSFLTAMDVVDALISCGRYHQALIVFSEIASGGLPWQAQPEVAALFGDGAAAAVFRQGPPLLATRFRSYPSAYGACQIGAGATRFSLADAPDAFAAHATFQLDGRALFRLTASHLAPFVADVLAQAGLCPNDIGLVVPHQASPKALDHMIRHCGFRDDQVLNFAAAHGKQIAASLPFGLDLARRSGFPPAGAKLLMPGTSAGVSFGGLVMDVMA